MRGLTRAGLCALAFTALVAAGCGSDDGDDKSDAGEATSKGEPRRGFESSSGDFTRNVQINVDNLARGERVKLTFDDQLELGDVDFDGGGGHVDQHTLTIRGTGNDDEGPSASVSVARESGTINGTAEIPSDAGKVTAYVSSTYAGEIDNGDFGLDIGK